MAEQVLTFGSFEVFPEQRLLLNQGKPLRLGSRAFDILKVLLERPGEVVPKEVLIRRVWPDTIVEDTSLRVHIAQLRKALGDDQDTARFITNVPGRGYCFVAPASVKGAAPAPAAPVPPPPPAAAARPVAPLPVARVIGRDDIVALVASQLPSRRFVTLAGPGGIGKTTAALAIAAAIAGRYDGGVAYVELAAIDDPQMAASALAAALGLAGKAGGLPDDLIASLHGRRTLVVLDNCEHVIDAAAGLAELLLRRVPDIDILATSREPLRADGEWVQRLPPLGLPGPDQAISAAQALAWPAVQLFAERASACLGGWTLGDADAPAVVEICRRLDGIALAIELAAGHLDTIGIAGLAASLDDCFRVLTRGRRTALPRHRTMRATLDWSYRLLSAAEQACLRRLSVFNGDFTLDDARAVIAGDGLDGWDIEDGLGNLVAKSLVTAELGGPAATYRLLATTRAYGREQLGRGPEDDALRRRHAVHYRALFDQAEAEWETRPTAEWLGRYGRHVGNLRAALDWAFSAEGDADIGVALTVAAVPLWFGLLLIDESLGWVQRALAVLDERGEAADTGRMRLQAALGWPQMRAIIGQASGAAAWTAALDLAQSLGDVDYQLRALWALWVDRTNAGEPRLALDLAERFAALAADPADICIGDRMRARSLHLLGDFAGAHVHVRRMLDRYVAPVNRAHVVRFQYDQRITARITLGRVLWLRGLPDQAMAEIEDNIAEALALDHNASLAHALADGAVPVALLSGDLAAAQRFNAMLKARTQARALDVWNTYAACFEGQILIRQGQAAAGVALLEGAIARLRHATFILYLTAFLGALGEGLAAAGRPAEGLATLDAALARCAETGEAWCTAELLRLRGQILAAGGQADAAETAYREALRIASDQQGPSWGLRAATSLAALWRSRGRAHEAVTLLEDAMAALGEGFARPDFQAAVRLHEALKHPPRAH